MLVLVVPRRDSQHLIQWSKYPTKEVISHLESRVVCKTYIRESTQSIDELESFLNYRRHVLTFQNKNSEYMYLRVLL